MKTLALSSVFYPKQLSLTHGLAMTTSMRLWSLNVRKPFKSSETLAQTCGLNEGKHQKKVALRQRRLERREVAAGAAMLCRWWCSKVHHVAAPPSAEYVLSSGLCSQGKSQGSEALKRRWFLCHAGPIGDSEYCSLLCPGCLWLPSALDILTVIL